MPQQTKVISTKFLEILVGTTQRKQKRTVSVIDCSLDCVNASLSLTLSAAVNWCSVVHCSNSSFVISNKCSASPPLIVTDTCCMCDLKFLYNGSAIFYAIASISKSNIPFHSFIHSFIHACIAVCHNSVIISNAVTPVFNRAKQKEMTHRISDAFFALLQIAK